ncbi:carbohydrate kinase family protein [bacterium]|nr:carbohydrate kinase family protein [bacterium]
MPRILVAGNVNLETSVLVGQFPIEYAKSRFIPHGVSDNPAGVGWNIALALRTLEIDVELAAILGRDALGQSLIPEIASHGIATGGIVQAMDDSPRSVILVGEEGRAAAFSDLKDALAQTYPLDDFDALLDRVDHVHATNIEWALALGRRAKERGKRVSTDVQAIPSVDDAYNRRFIEIADVVFFSDENLEQDAESAIQTMWNRGVQIAICGCGADGAMLGVRESQTIATLPATPTRPVVSTIGAGDSLVSGFLSGFVSGLTPRDALARAQYFAGHMIGEPGATRGFLKKDELDRISSGQV